MSGYAIVDQIAKTANSARHHRHAIEHRFERGDTKCFELARQAKDGGLTVKPSLSGFIEPACEMNALSHAKTDGVVAPAIDIPVPGQLQMDITPLLHQPSQCFDQCVQTLLSG